MKYVWLALALVLVTIMSIFFNIVGGPTIVTEYLKHEQSEDLDFTFSYCVGESESEESVDSIEWGSGRVTIDVTLKPNCGTTWLFGDYRLKGNELVLGYKSIMPGLIACDCPYKATYEISGLEKKKYEIKLKEYAFIYKNPLVYKLFVGEVDDHVQIESL